MILLNPTGVPAVGELIQDRRKEVYEKVYFGSRFLFECRGSRSIASFRWICSFELWYNYCIRPDLRRNCLCNSIERSNMYPPEYVALYLLLGLGIAWVSIANGKAIDISRDWKGFFSLLIAIPFGIFLGLIVIVIWPAYFMAILVNFLRK